MQARVLAPVSTAACGGATAAEPGCVRDGAARQSVKHLVACAADDLSQPRVRHVRLLGNVPQAHVQLGARVARRKEADLGPKLFGVTPHAAHVGLVFPGSIM